ncbi:hypothetical protein THIOM_002899 [Candidatus Thiomargarita nelsonii]|uniref:Uncharacterized protein n=1 Tax=Candidatus Thiomargarita nelsonii TaxID=1003181 RepID=A0A176S075_9GAMM|nr:hypothetical protein THIOM_002899 [Candidatus Thiomargarita nelsonii]
MKRFKIVCCKTDTIIFNDNIHYRRNLSLLKRQLGFIPFKVDINTTILSAQILYGMDGINNRL